jgi:hypothetical protein
VSEIIKSLGKKILEGNFADIMKISRPASISYPLSFLQAASRDFSYTEYLTQAALSPDPVFRLQMVTTFIIAGLHINPVAFGNFPPLNPILGETHSATLKDGSKIWLEQTSHHPPVTNWFMEGPDQLFTFYGHGQIKAGLAGPNTIRASKEGKHVLRFLNGDVIHYTAPAMKIKGIILGQRTVNFEGSFNVVDETNNLTAIITFVEDKGIVAGLKGKIRSFWKAEKKLPTDHFDIKIFRDFDGNKEEVASGFGSWLEYVKFGNKNWWTIEMAPSDVWVTAPDKLPSDSVHRDDLMLLDMKCVDQAQNAKERLENLQRADKVLRENAKKSKAQVVV